MPLGTKVSYADSTTAERSVVVEFDVMSPREVPFLKLISGGDAENPGLNALSAPCIATKHEWIEDEDFNLQTTLGAAIADGTTTSVTLAASGYGKINEGAILLVDDEQMRVTSVAANPITVTRAWGGTTGASHSSGATVLVIGHVSDEKGAAPTSVYSYPTMPFNYVQQLVDKISLSEIEQSIARYGVDNAVEYETAKRVAELAKKLERQCFYGKRVAPSSSTPGAFGGLKEFIPTANRLDASGGALTVTQIRQLMRTITEGVGDNKRPTTIVVNSKLRAKITDIYTASAFSNQHRPIESRRGGTTVQVITTDWGDIDVLYSPWCPQNELFLVWPEKIGIGPLRGRDFKRTMLAKTGPVDEWMIAGAYTLEVRSSLSHGVIFNINPNA